MFYAVDAPPDWIIFPPTGFVFTTWKMTAFAFPGLKSLQALFVIEAGASGLNGHKSALLSCIWH